MKSGSSACTQFGGGFRFGGSFQLVSSYWSVCTGRGCRACGVSGDGNFLWKHCGSVCYGLRELIMSYSNPFSTLLFELIYPNRPSSARCTTTYHGWLFVHKQCDRVSLTSPSSTEDESLDVSCLYVSMFHRFIKHFLGFFTCCMVKKNTPTLYVTMTVASCVSSE